MRTLNFVGSLCFVGILALSSSVKGEVIIDDFQTAFDVSGQAGYSGMSPNSLGTGSNVFQLTQTSPAGAIGDRNARFSVTPVGGLGGDLTIVPSPNLLAVSLDGAVENYAYAISYSVTDLDLSGETRFVFDLEGDLDDRPVPAVARFGINITSGGTTESRGINVSADGSYSIPFSFYTNTDFSDIDGIEIASNGMIPGVDYVIGPVSAVPEPSSATMLVTILGMGLAGLRRWNA